MNEIIRYLIHRLIGDDMPPEVTEQIGYTNDRSQFKRYRLVIIPSGFVEAVFEGQQPAVPALPLRQIEGIPLLYGSPHVEHDNRTLVIHADLIASTLFLVSRYEETVSRTIRDRHGRFPGRASLPYRAGFLNRPVVDEYGRLLRRLLTAAGTALPHPPQGIRQVNLTHDVDVPYSMRTWRNMVRGVLNRQNPVHLLRTKFGPIEHDPHFTFPEILQADNQVRQVLTADRCSSLFFVRAGGKDRHDRPFCNLDGHEMQTLAQLIAREGGTVGLHASYDAGRNPSLIAGEKQQLERAFRTSITANRHHFLSLREPEDTQALEAAGIHDDYTMGYADVAGFRLGTCRPVRWIDLANRRLSALTLHPLTVMDDTLIRPEYMGLMQDEALKLCVELIQQTAEHHGELTLLWHNDAFIAGGDYLRQLYHTLTDILCCKHS